jgi:nitrate/TMAO reductase-like tetraheme cytochrome c subunit
VEYEIELERKCEWVVDFSYYSYTLATYMITSGLHELQHNRYDTALPGNKATNSSYHQNIYNEYETSGNIHYRDPANMNCEDCHINRARYAYASGEPWNAQQGNWAPFRHKNLTANMESLDGWCDYKTDKVCVACHIADGDFSPLAFPNDNGGLRITIYSEPGVKVDYTYY